MDVYHFVYLHHNISNSFETADKYIPIITKDPKFCIAIYFYFITFSHSPPFAQSIK